MEETGETHKVNWPGCQVTYPVSELVKHLLDETALGHGMRYKVHQILMKGLNWSLNTKLLPDLREKPVGSSSAQNINKNHMTDTPET